MPRGTQKPRTRTVSAKGIVHAISGPERPYPVYRFSRKRFYERPKHNPFAGS